MYLCYNVVGVEVNFQLTSMSVGENASIINFTLGISGQDAMIVLGSLTMVSLTAMDGSASKYIRITLIAMNSS